MIQALLRYTNFALIRRKTMNEEQLMANSYVQIGSGGPVKLGRRLVAACQNSLSRDELFASLFILGCANGLLGRIIFSLSLDGWVGAILGVDINAILLFACFAGISTLLGAKKDAIRSTDIAVAVVFLILVMLPIVPLSWLAVTGLSFYILLFAKGDSERRRGALILLAVTVPMLWSKLLFQLFAKTILDIDAMLVASILGTDRVGNLVGFADGSGSMVVLPACSSLANMSLAFLGWVSITQWLKHKWSAVDIFWSVLICASVIVLNVSRISLMGLSQWHYRMIHGEWGDLVGNTLMLLLIVGFSLLGSRRELFSRA